MSFYIGQVPTLVQTALAFPNTLVSGWLNVSRHSTSTPPQAALQCCRLLLTSPVISPLFLMKWQVQVISFRTGPTTVKQWFRCIYSHGILVFVVLLTKCFKWLTNAGTPHTLVHTMAEYTAFHYELATWGSSCTWSLCLFTFVFL